MTARSGHDRSPLGFGGLAPKRRSRPKGRSARRCARAGVRGHLQEVEDAAWFPGQIAHGLGDAEPAPLDEADGEAALSGHVHRTVPGADTAAVLVEAPVEDVVCGLDGPVPAIEGEQAFRRGGLAVQAGDPVGRLDASLGGLDLDGFPAHGEDLSDAGEVEVAAKFAGGPDGAALVVAVFGLCGLDGEVRCAPGDALVESEPDVVMQGWLVALDGEQMVGPAAEQIIGEAALGE